MRKVDLLQAFIAALAVDAVAGGRALASAVHCQHRAVVEGRGQESAGFMRKMMLDVMPLPRPVMPATLESLLQVMRRAVRQLARRIDNIGQRQRVPWRQ